MSDYLNIYNSNLQKVAVLQNAHNILEDERLNAVGSLTFDLPFSDTKASHCEPFFFAQYEGGQLHRILKPKRKRSNTSIRSYVCEHVIATLIDDVIFGYEVIGGRGMYTSDVINYILTKQTVKRWVLGECDFHHQFEYGLENENLLAALWSIPNRFTQPYMWSFDTSSYPWRLSLKMIDENAQPQYYIRAAKNLLTSETESDYANICTRLYPLGYGEGINQLNVKEVNGGLPYIQSDDAVVAKYGGAPISRILVDRRYEDAQSLLEYGRAQLKGLEQPVLSTSVSVADLYRITQADYDKAEIGRVVLLTEDNTKTYITGISRKWDSDGDMSLTIANKPADIAGTIADLADRQRIESVYSQGATQIYAQSVQANATPDIGAVIRFYIPDDMRIINYVKAKITLDRFRSYSKATAGGGRTTRTSSAGGNQTTTSGSGGDSRQTSSAGGDSTTTSSSGGEATSTSTNGGGASTTSGASSEATTTVVGEKLSTSKQVAGGGSGYTTSVTVSSLDSRHNHQFTLLGTSHSHSLANHAHGMSHTHSVTVQGHTHSVSVPGHTHSVSLPSHTHSVTIPSHTHSITIRDHTHTIEIPDHAHSIEQGIFEFGRPTSAAIYANGVKKADMTTEGELDISVYLTNDQKKIPRGSWLEVEVVPNDLAYVTIDIVIKGFVQSRGGSIY